MKTLEKTLLSTLEPWGLALLVRGALSRPEMVRIANASRVSVPGMRNRSVSLEHLSEALVDKFVAGGPSRRLILKALGAATRATTAAYRRMSADELRERLADPERVRTDPETARLLYLLIAEPKDGISLDEVRAAVVETAQQRAAEAAAAPADPGPDAEIQALRREKADLSRRAAELVALVDRLRERDRRFREEIAQRKFDINNLKLAIGKHKKERESLEKELRRVTLKAELPDKKGAIASEASATMSAALSEIRKLAAGIDRLQPRQGRDDRQVTGGTKLLDEVRKETLALHKRLEADRDKVIRAIDESFGKIAEALKAPLTPAAGTDGAKRAPLDRVGVFVDVQNVFYGARGQNAKLDFDLLLQATTRGRRLVRAVAYVVEAKEIDQSGFIALLQQKRYEVKRKDLKVRADGSFKGDWDMEIALDALEMADALDVMVLVTGDGDFTSLVQKIRVRGPRVEVYAFPQNTAKELRESADRFVPIDKRMLIKSSRVGPRPQPTGAARGPS